MSKVNTKSKQATELYAVMIEGNPIVVEASSLEQAAVKAKKQASTQEVGDV